MSTDKNWSEAKEHLEQYVTAQLKLLKLTLVEKSTNIIAALLSSLLIYLLLFFATLFISVAGAIVINEYTNSTYLGYLAVAGLYFFVCLVLSLTRKAFLKKELRNSLIKKIYENDGRI